MQRNDELMHYGVLGMKWGQRRARKNYEKAKRAKESAKEWDQISRHKKSKGNVKGSDRATRNAAQDRADAKKYEAKAKRIEKKHIGRAGGKKAYDYTKNQSTGKALAKSMLMGTYGTLKYNKARSQGKGRAASAVRGVGANLVSQNTGMLTEIIEPRITQRNGGRTMGDVLNAGYAVRKKRKK